MPNLIFFVMSELKLKFLRQRHRIIHVSHMLPYLWSTELIYRKITRSIEKSPFAALKKKCTSELPTNYVGGKYLNSSLYLRINIVKALMLDLQRQSPLKILDIGCGAGYFLYVCRHFGHEILGLDIKDNLIYDEFIRFLEIPRLSGRVQPYHDLPDFGKRFDIITAFSIVFDHQGETYWGVAEWQFFFRDVYSKLVPTGKLLLYFNRPVATYRAFQEMLSKSSLFEVISMNVDSVLLLRVST